MEVQPNALEVNEEATRVLFVLVIIILFLLCDSLLHVIRRLRDAEKSLAMMERCQGEQEQYLRFIGVNQQEQISTIDELVKKTFIASKN